MARLPELTDRDALPPEAHPAYDAIAASRGRVAGLFAVLMNSPEVAARTAHLGTYVRFEKSLPQDIHELAMITGAHEAGGAMEWRGHSRAAREAGIPEATIEAVEHNRDLAGLPADHALVIGIGRSLIRDHSLDDASFEAARARWGDQGVVDICATLGYQAYLGCILNGLDIGTTPPPAQ